jgi:hypothetical protein
MLSYKIGQENKNIKHYLYQVENYYLENQPLMIL